MDAVICVGCLIKATRAILVLKIPEIFSVENKRQVGCYDVAKFRFVS